MDCMTRRTFLGFTTAASGAFYLGNTLGCGTPAPEKPVTKKTRSHPLDGIEREDIKITDIKVTPLCYVPPDKKYMWLTGNNITWKTEAAPCEVFTNKGIVGIGEGSPYAGAQLIKKYAEEVIKPALIGKNPFDVEFLACGGQDYNGHTTSISAETAAWAGVDTALWDIIGKVKNVPVYNLLATDYEPNTHLRTYASGGDLHEWYNNGAETLIEEALRYKEMGFTAFKFRCGTDWKYSNMTLKKYIPVMRRLREAVGPDFDLIHEGVGSTGMTLDEVLEEFCPLLEELKFHFFEQPMGGIEEYIKIKEALPTVMVSGGESDVNRFQIKEWIDRDALDIVQTDNSWTGISEGWHIAHMAHLFGKRFCPHNWHGGLTIMGNAYLAAGIPNQHMLEYNANFNPLKDEVFKEPLVVKNGYMDLPNKPGYGLELAPDLAKKFPWVPGDARKPNPVISKK